MDLVDLFECYGCKPVCCNSQSGANAFFISSQYSNQFDDVPCDVNNIYVAPRYHIYLNHCHNLSVAFVNSIIKRQLKLFSYGVC